MCHRAGTLYATAWTERSVRCEPRMSYVVVQATTRRQMYTALPMVLNVTAGLAVAVAATALAVDRIVMSHPVSVDVSKSLPGRLVVGSDASVALASQRVWRNVWAPLVLTSLVFAATFVTVQVTVYLSGTGARGGLAVSRELFHGMRQRAPLSSVARVLRSDDAPRFPSAQLTLFLCTYAPATAALVGAAWAWPKAVTRLRVWRATMTVLAASTLAAATLA